MTSLIDLYDHSISFIQRPWNKNLITFPIQYSATIKRGHLSNVFDDFLLQWNYRVVPLSQSNGQVI